MEWLMIRIVGKNLRILWCLSQLDNGWVRASGQLRKNGAAAFRRAARGRAPFLPSRPFLHTDNTLNYSTHYLYSHFCQRHSRWIHKGLYVLIRLKLTDQNGAAEQKVSREFTPTPRYIALIGEINFNIQPRYALK